MNPNLALHALTGIFVQILIMSCLNIQSSYPNIGPQNAEDSMYTVLEWNFKTLTIWFLVHSDLEHIIYSPDFYLYIYILIIEINVFHMKFNVIIRNQKII